ncbi:MAG: hypothetical protein ACOC78_02095 [Actinomycetota bacterium]
MRVADDENDRCEGLTPSSAGFCGTGARPEKVPETPVDPRNTPSGVQAITVLVVMSPVLVE